MVEKKGLSSEEAKNLLKKFGPNTLPEEKYHPLIILIKKFWAPIPLLLMLIIAVELSLKKITESWIVLALLLFNVLLSFFQEQRAKKALLLLREKLEVQTRVFRDNEWLFLPAKELVPGDIICLRMGDIIPADAELFSGYISIDQSAITGESLPIEGTIGKMAFAGSIVKQGESFAEVKSTGTSTKYGVTAEIIRFAKAPSNLQKTIFQIIKYLIIIDLLLIFSIFLYSINTGVSLADLLPFALLLFVASVPVALPATVTLATSLGSLELVKSGILVTRLSAIEEAAAMTVLCVDKTGTITQNQLKVTQVTSFSPYTKEDLITLAAFASEEATQDPIDLAIFEEKKEMSTSRFLQSKRLAYLPFDPEKKCSEATLEMDGKKQQVRKGAPFELIKGIKNNENLSKQIEDLSRGGVRVLGVVLQEEMVGFIALQDLPRVDASKTIQEIQNLGIKVLMLTGDSVPTAQSIAEKVGIGKRVISHDELKQNPAIKLSDVDAVAGIFPEDKVSIITSLQKEGLICGMTGDGVNDAPALKKAEVGIAVKNATDIAKASASVVLTRPGLPDMIEAIKVSRRIYQRMLTYTLNKIIKTLEISVLLSIGLMLIGNFIISQLLLILLLFSNDFVTMSVATDKVTFSQEPNRWNVKKLILIGMLLAAFLLGYSFFILNFGEKYLHLSLAPLQTFIFLTLVFSGQMNIYLIREKYHFWKSMPSFWMMLSSILAILILCVLAVKSILMAPIQLLQIIALFCGTAVYFVLLDFLKVQLFKKSRISMNLSAKSYGKS